MLDGHLDLIETATRRIKSNLAEECAIHFTPHQANQRDLEFQNHEIDNILAMNVIQQPQKELPKPTVVAPKKGQNTPNLHGLPQTELNIHLELLPYTAHGRMPQRSW